AIRPRRAPPSLAYRWRPFFFFSGSSFPDLLSHPHVLTSFLPPRRLLPPTPPLPPLPLAPSPARRRPSRSCPAAARCLLLRPQPFLAPPTCRRPPPGLAQPLSTPSAPLPPDFAVTAGVLALRPRRWSPLCLPSPRPDPDGEHGEIFAAEPAPARAGREHPPAPASPSPERATRATAAGYRPAPATASNFTVSRHRPSPLAVAALVRR
ncbi:unnamed protein product, partial [Urochloa humidicola]